MNINLSIDTRIRPSNYSDSKSKIYKFNGKELNFKCIISYTSVQSRLSAVYERHRPSLF